jgi:hypothetical protein
VIDPGGLAILTDVEVHHVDLIGRAVALDESTQSNSPKCFE